MNGKRPGYVLQIVKAVRHYGRFINRDLNIKYPKRESQRLPQYLSESELKQMLFSCQGVKERLVLLLMAACGLRINEVCRLRISDVNFDTATLRVPTAKTDSAWEIPVSNDVLEATHTYLAYERPKVGHEELILDRHGRPFNAENCHGIRLMIHRIAKRARIQKRVYPHVLRHSYATLLLRNGCPLPYVQRLLRHKNIKSTLVYSHVVEEALREVYERCAPLRLSSPTIDQKLSLQAPKLPSQTPQGLKCEVHQSYDDNTSTANHRRGARNGYI
jgi:integrase/recombinase XerC